MLKKICFSLLTIAPFCFTNAQEIEDSAAKKSNFAISGYADVYYRYNFNNPKKDLGMYNNYTSFTNSQNSFELGMASVKLEHSFGKVGMVADLGFGKRAEEFSYNDANTMLAIKQAYLTYAPTENLKFTAGSWATHVGYELVDPYLNRNYSMSYMFSYGPFFHTGIKADYTFGNSGFMVGVANPTDLKSANFSSKFLIAQYSVASANEKLHAYVNYQGGKSSDSVKLNQVDVVLTGAISDKFSIGYNGTVQGIKAKSGNGKFGDANSWWGSALYLNVDPASWFGLTLRGEYFDDKKAVTGGAFGASIFETTLSANFKIGDHLTLIPELRMDNANEHIFVKNSGALTKKSTTGLFAAIYHF